MNKYLYSTCLTHSTFVKLVLLGIIWMMAFLLAILWIIVFRTPAQAQEIIIMASLPHVTFEDSNEAAVSQWKLSARGEVERGWLSMSVQDLTLDLAQSFGSF